MTLMTELAEQSGWQPLVAVVHIIWEASPGY